MMLRLVSISLWLIAGCGVAGAAYWAFLVTPESSAGALALSAVFAVVTLILLAITVNGASLAWSNGWSATTVGRSASGVPAFLIAALLTFAIWWAVGTTTSWISAHSGEISAWFIARLGWADLTPLFTGVTWGGRWLRWVVGPLLGLSLLGSLLASGWTSGREGLWLARAVSPVRLLLATLWFALLVAVPWTYLAPWRPRNLPATSVELVFIAAKLSVTAILMAIGAALFVRQSTE